MAVAQTEAISHIAPVQTGYFFSLHTDRRVTGRRGE
jgi:hypothetical protein